MTDLVDRILDAVPTGNYGLQALFRIVDIRESREIATAAVQGGDQPRLLINPDFAERYASTPERLLIVVMHELYHVILGHTRDLSVDPDLDNLVFDAVINAILCRAFPDPRGIALLTDLYPADLLPGALLRPAPGWTPDGPSVRNAFLVASGHGRLAEVHEALYGPTGVAYGEIVDALRDALPPGSAATAQLLGRHGSDDDHAAQAGGLSPAFVAELRAVAERWPGAGSKTMAGQAVQGFLRETFLPPRPIRSNRGRLRDLLRWVAGDGPDGRIRTLEEGTRSSISPMPSGSRRDVVLGLLGSPILLHEGRTPAPAPSRTGDRVHLYLDVSGSVMDIVPALSGAVTDCADLVHPIVHAFSTEIAETTLADLRKGAIRTTGGTDIACVAGHARDGRIRRAVIITDGFVGFPGRADRETLAGIRLGAAWTPGFSEVCLSGLVDRSTQLEVRS